MGGPIVRTGTNPKFWEGWDKVFNKKGAAGKPAAKKAAGKSAKPKAVKKAKKSK